MRHPIIALVGPSGSGKSALIIEMLRRMPDELAIIKTVSTRERRDASDDIHYRLIDARHYAAITAFGALIQGVRYRGASYGNAVQDVDPLLKRRAGITALVEQGVLNFRERGYTVYVIRVVPAGPDYKNRGPEREAEDKAREEAIPLHGYRLTNEFALGGFEHACDQLKTIIQVLLY